MAKVWVEGYTKADGTKVAGHYREVSASKARKMASHKIRTWKPALVAKRNARRQSGQLARVVEAGRFIKTRSLNQKYKRQSKRLEAMGGKAPVFGEGNLSDFLKSKEYKTWAKSTAKQQGRTRRSFAKLRTQKKY